MERSGITREIHFFLNSHWERSSEGAPRYRKGSVSGANILRFQWPEIFCEDSQSTLSNVSPTTTLEILSMSRPVSYFVKRNYYIHFRFEGPSGEKYEVGVFYYQCSRKDTHSKRTSKHCVGPTSCTVWTFVVRRS